MTPASPLRDTSPTHLVGMVVFTPEVHVDPRGLFLEMYSARAVDEALGGSFKFVQDNLARSKKGVIRGLHYQLPPHAQGKLVWVTRGSVFDVAVDLRRGSPTFGRWHAMYLRSRDFTHIWLPPGLAHGYLALEDDSEVVYKVTDYYAPETERSVAWNDPDLGIQWPTEIAPILSSKDAAAPPLATAEHFLPTGAT